jgi:hypothetical protein
MGTATRREHGFPRGGTGSGMSARNAGRNTAMVFAAFFGVVVGAGAAPTLYHVWHAATETVPSEKGDPAVATENGTDDNTLSVAPKMLDESRTSSKPGLDRETGTSTVSVPAAVPKVTLDADDVVPVDQPDLTEPSSPANAATGEREYALAPLTSRFEAALPKDFEERLTPEGSADDGGIDLFRTGSVEVAESEDQVTEIEIRLAKEGAEHFEIPEEQETVAAIAAPAAPEASADLRTVLTTKWVNLRAGPDNDAAVVAVVPARAEIRAETGCRHWCEAVYDGNRGYIYKTFLSDGSQPAVPRKNAEAENVKTETIGPDISELR